MKKIIIGITGASGAIYGITLLKILKIAPDIQTHLIISKAAYITIKNETDCDISDIVNLADYYHNNNNIAACVSSGSFLCDGMIIAPCSTKTLSEIATGNSNNLISRSADVALKEKRKLLLMLRETPLNYIHIKNMLTVTKMGGIIAPPLNSFYIKPQSIEELVEYSVLRALDIFDIHIESNKRWNGI
jgi:polyprenyl P-hydroxybenzoate/phenylacrylic acid decarboxylase-like protein